MLYDQEERRGLFNWEAREAMLTDLIEKARAKKVNS